MLFIQSWCFFYMVMFPLVFLRKALILKLLVKFFYKKWHTYIASYKCITCEHIKSVYAMGMKGMPRVIVPVSVKMPEVCGSGY